MTKFLALIFGGLTALTAVAMLWRPAADTSGKKPIVWVCDNNPARIDQINEFNRLHPDLKLVLDYSNNDAQKTLVQATSRVGPDIFNTFGGTIQAYANAGIMLDLTEEAKALGCSVADTWPAVKNEISYLGRQYSYPCNAGSDILIYNKNVFDRLDIPYPQKDLSWEDLFALGQQIRSKSNGQVFAVARLNWAYFFASLGGQYFSEDGTQLLINTDKMRRAFQTHKDCLFEYKIMPTSVELNALSGQGGWGAGELNQFAAGRFAMIMIGEWSNIGFRRQYHDQMERIARWEAADPATRGPRPEVIGLGAMMIPHFAGMPPAYNVGTRSAAINVDSKSKEDALKFLQYLAGPEYAQLINKNGDNLPGNPKYADLGVEPGPPELARMEMHEATKESMNYGFAINDSPYLLSSDVNRVLAEQVSRMETNPSLKVEEMLASAQKELEKLMQRNLKRDPRLRKDFEQRVQARDNKVAAVNKGN